MQSKSSGCWTRFKITFNELLFSILLLIIQQLFGDYTVSHKKLDCIFSLFPKMDFYIITQIYWMVRNDWSCFSLLLLYSQSLIVWCCLLRVGSPTLEMQTWQFNTLTGIDSITNFSHKLYHYNFNYSSYSKKLMTHETTKTLDSVLCHFLLIENITGTNKEYYTSCKYICILVSWKTVHCFRILLVYQFN